MNLNRLTAVAVGVVNVATLLSSAALAHGPRMGYGPGSYMSTHPYGWGSMAYPHGMTNPITAYPYAAPGYLHAPVPYPGVSDPYHWIWNYMPTHTYDPYGRGRIESYEGHGRTYSGRETMYPALPYSEYLRSRRVVPVTSDLETPASTTPTADTALLEIRVPVDQARVFLDDQEVAGQGKVRFYRTPSLKAGAYRFRVKAQWATDLFDDQAIQETITFRPGEHKIVELKKK